MISIKEMSLVECWSQVSNNFNLLINLTLLECDTISIIDENKTVFILLFNVKPLLMT